MSRDRDIRCGIMGMNGDIRRIPRDSLPYVRTEERR